MEKFTEGRIYRNIDLVNSEEYEEKYTKEPCIDIAALSNDLTEFIINTKLI